MKLGPKTFLARVELDFGNRWKTALETSLVMFLCAAGLSIIQVQKRHSDLTDYFALVGVPASAAASYVVIACLSPDLATTRQIKFPFNFTLPLVFCGLLPVCSLLVSTPERGLMAAMESVQYARLWQQPVELIIVLLMEIVALSLFGLISRR